ncbi:MAG: hypothetical protein SVW57_12090, partial [Thermodesulfobacteriota bacterium]|nr:hypothetical protein [Thermodesulfobacteriota bacterium]
MNEHKTPDLTEELLNRIKLVRRDFGSLLFHFTRAPKEPFVKVDFGQGHTMSMSGSASSVLRKILYEGRLNSTSNWSHGQSCVCFTEAPIQEFNSIFSLVEIAASEKERPRYEPYGIGVSKRWLFSQGGRPVIYDHPDSFASFTEDQLYRFVPSNPVKGIDFT